MNCVFVIAKPNMAEHDQDDSEDLANLCVHALLVRNCRNRVRSSHEDCVNGVRHADPAVRRLSMRHH